MRSTSVRQVTITGTWSRTKTDRRDVHFYRQRMRARARAIGATFEATCPTKHQPRAYEGTLQGTFKFTVMVDSGQNPEKVARAILQALVAKTMCRGPKLRFDRNAKVEYVRTWDVGLQQNIPLEVVL